MTITLQVNNVPYANFNEIAVQKSIDDLVGTFAFSAVNSQIIFPFKVGNSCTINVDGDVLINGFIDKIEGNYDKDSHIVTISGRDRTADILDSLLCSGINFKAPISLASVITQTLQKVGITGITVKNNVQGLADFGTSDLVAGQIGQSVFDFIEKYARKRQVLITTDNIGDIIITRSSTDSQNLVLLNQLNNSQNNIKSAEFAYDNSQRFYQYQFYSQGNAVTQNDVGTTTSNKSSTVASSALDKSIRNTRYFNQIAEQSTDQTGLKDRSTWEGNLRMARSLIYSATVQGFRQPNGKLWDINRLIKVIDDFAAINSILLINTVKFELSTANGSITTLGMVDKDSYKLALEIDNSQNSKKGKKQGQGTFTLTDADIARGIQAEQIPKTT